MLTKNFERLQSEVADHVKADRVAQGSYENGLVGCLAQEFYDSRCIENKYGIPFTLVRIAESIFEGLPADEAIKFFADFAKAGACDGKDLTRVGWQFLAAELRALPPVPNDTQAVIDPVIKGMDLLAEGKEWPEAAVKAAINANAANATRAATAVWSTIWPAADAAYAYANATRAAQAKSAAFWSAATWPAQAKAAAIRRQRDTLLRLISEAPVNALI